MTATNANDDARTNAAAAWFTVALGLMFGGAGVVLAAVAVGFERALFGTGQRTGGLWDNHLADQREWLATDRERRRAWREERRRWWANGADPDARPTQPSGTGTRFGSWLRRSWARLCVAGDAAVRGGGRFLAGVRAGWRAANEARRRGASFREIVKTRPAAPTATGEPSPAQPTDTAGQPAAPAPVGTPDVPAPAPDTPAPVRKPSPRPRPTDTGTPAPAPSAQPQPVPPQEETMTVTAPAGETHAQVAAAMIADISGDIQGIGDLTDQIAAHKNRLADRVARATEYVQANGGTTGTQRALDEAAALIAQLDRHLSDFSDASLAAGDSTVAADAELRPAHDAQDLLHAAGATGRFVDTATSD
jgi:hypothetical protein